MFVCRYSRLDILKFQFNSIQFSQNHRRAHWWFIGSDIANREIKSEIVSYWANSNVFNEREMFVAEIFASITCKLLFSIHNIHKEDLNNCFQSMQRSFSYIESKSFLSFRSKQKKITSQDDNRNAASWKLFANANSAKTPDIWKKELCIITMAIFMLVLLCILTYCNFELSSGSLVAFHCIHSPSVHSKRPNGYTDNNR